MLFNTSWSMVSRKTISSLSPSYKAICSSWLSINSPPMYARKRWSRPLLRCVARSSTRLSRPSAKAPMWSWWWCVISMLVGVVAWLCWFDLLMDVFLILDYVLQRALSVVEGDQKETLVNKIKPQLVQLRKQTSHFSKHLLASKCNSCSIRWFVLIVNSRPPPREVLPYR